MKILQSPTADNLQNMMKNGDKDLINSIPLKSLKNSNFNINAIPPANLPDSYVLLFLKKYLLYLIII